MAKNENIHSWHGMNNFDSYNEIYNTTLHIKYFYIRYHPDERSLENEIIYKSYDVRHLYVNLHRLQQCNQYSRVHFTLDLRLFSPW